MKREEARLISRELKETCVNRCGKCWNKKEECNKKEKCNKFLGENLKPQNYDLIDLIDYIEEKF